MTEECDQSDEAESHIQMTLLSAAAVSEAPVARPASPQAITTQPPPQAALREEFEEELEQLDPLQLFSSDNNMSESEIAKAVVAENRKYVYHGEVSPALQVRMERGTAPQLVPRHRLHKDCQSYKKYPVCYEAAPGYFMKLATKTFQQSIS